MQTQIDETPSVSQMRLPDGHATVTQCRYVHAPLPVFRRSQSVSLSNREQDYDNCNIVEDESDVYTATSSVRNEHTMVTYSPRSPAIELMNEICLER